LHPPTADSAQLDSNHRDPLRTEKLGRVVPRMVGDDLAATINDDSARNGTHF
jgi:hypothetical protein